MPDTNETFDVVICGYGGAGAAAAIAAHDDGARVLVAEKAAEGGGSTQESGGSLASIVDPAGAVEHYVALTERRTPRTVVEAYVGGVMELESWILANGGELEPLPMWRPPFPHRYEGTAYATMPCSDAIGPRRRLAEPGVDHGGTALWRFLDRNVHREASTSAPVWAADDLVVRAGVVAGVTVRNGGRTGHGGG